MNYIIIAGGYATAGAIVGFGVNYILTYYSRKSELINEAVEGKQPFIKEKRYRSALDMVFAFGRDLAEKRFKAGKFEKLIEKYTIK